MTLLADTGFLIQLWRSGNLASAANLNEPVHIAWITRAEFLRGSVIARQVRPETELFLDEFTTRFPNMDTVKTFAEQYALLHAKNQRIGDHDLWIASIALQYDIPLMTRNRHEFERIGGLRIVDF